MDAEPSARKPFDAGQYVRRCREGPCFICAMLAGHPGYPHHDVYDDGETIADATMGHWKHAVWSLGNGDFLSAYRQYFAFAFAFAPTTTIVNVVCPEPGD